MVFKTRRRRRRRKRKFVGEETCFAWNFRGGAPIGSVPCFNDGFKGKMAYFGSL